VCGGDAGRLWWSEKLAMPRGASPKWVGAPGPTEEERERLVRSGGSEPIAKTGPEAVAPLPTDGEYRGVDKMHGGGLLL
jgi:hypothetical protein